MQRRKFKGTPLHPNIGYGSNKKTRNLLPNGLYDALIHNVADLEKFVMQVSAPLLVANTPGRDAGTGTGRGDGAGARSPSGGHPSPTTHAVAAPAPWGGRRAVPWRSWTSFPGPGPDLGGQGAASGPRWGRPCCPFAPGDRGPWPRARRSRAPRLAPGGALIAF